MIDRYNANAIILMGRLLHYLSKKHKFSIINLQGGLMDNAIPREANCHILISKSHSKDFEKLIAEFEKTIKNEFSANEKNMMIYCENLGQTKEEVLKPRLQERVIFLLNTIPEECRICAWTESRRGW
jgi:Peptidase dimerisation domain.